MQEFKAFLKRVMPSSGFFYLVKLIDERDRTPDNRRGAVHRAAQANDLNTADRALWYLRNKVIGRENIYFTFWTYTIDYGDKGNVRKNPEYLHRTKVFVVDLDCGPGKPYPDKDTAFLAAAKFVQDTGLPKPQIALDSGGGAHLYWVMDRELTVGEWLPKAEALKKLAKLKGFLIDPTPTADTSRIMRLPGTVNSKYEPPQPSTVIQDTGTVTSCEEFFSVLSQYENVTPIGPKHNPGFTDNDEFNSGIQRTGRPSYTKNILKQCPMLANVAETHGAWCDEPTWKAVLQVIHRTEDGVEWVVPLSDGHPGYSQQAAMQKFEERANDFGPATCDHLHNTSNGEDFCSKCQHFGRIKSPWVLGMESAPIVLQPQNALPDNYELRQDGVFYIKQSKEGTERVRILSFPIYSVEIFTQHLEEGVETFMHIVHGQTAGKRKEVVIPQSALEAQRTVFRAAVAKGLTLEHRELKGFIDLMYAWVKKLRSNGDVEEYVLQYGWQMTGYDGKEAKPSGFAVGDTLYTAEGEETHTVKFFPNITEMYSPHGSADVWRRAVELVLKRNDPALEVLLSTAFAAPLLLFAKYSGVVLSAVSKASGTGKSSTLRTAQAVWGNPQSGIFALNDTPNSVNHRLGVLNTLPAYWDEIRMKDDMESFVKMAFALSQGKDRTRLTQTVEQRKTGKWRTMLVAASNHPLLDYVDEVDRSGEAGNKRFLEFHIDSKPDNTTAYDSGGVFSDLDYNYGHAGREYARWLAQNAERVQSIVDKVLNDIVRPALNPDHSHRFWVSTIVACISGAYIAKELGLVAFNVEQIKDFLFKVYLNALQTTKEDLKAQSVADILQQAMEDMTSEGLLTNHIITKRGVGAVQEKGELEIIHTPKDVGIPVNYHYAQDDKILRISKQHFDRWLRRNKMGVKEFFAMCEREEGIKVYTNRSLMGAGTPYVNNLQPRIYEFLFSYDPFSSMPD